MKMPLEEPLTTAQLHFSFVSKQRLHVVTEETLRLVFGYFGEVADVSIKKSIINPVSYFFDNYLSAFVHYFLYHNVSGYWRTNRLWVCPLPTDF
jgi:hypothetical protein